MLLPQAHLLKYFEASVRIVKPVSSSAMSNPLVSVVIPAFNRAHTLQRSIDSVLNQTYRCVEVIIVDDGSTDGTQEVLRSYGGKIRWLFQRNSGPSSARNSGIREAKGEYVAFLDSDDAWAPTKIERQIGLLRRCSSDVVCCLCNTLFTGQAYSGKTAFEIAMIFPSREESIWINTTEVLITRFVLFNQAAVVKRDVLRSLGGFDEKLRLMEDYDLALRLSVIGPWAIIQAPLVYWYPDPKTSLSIGAERGKAEQLSLEILAKFLRDYGLDNRLSTITKRRLLALHGLLQISRLCSRIEDKFSKLNFAAEILFTISERVFNHIQSLPKVVTIPVSTKT